MVIEKLTFRVPACDQQQFIAADSEIWTPTLAAQDGFLGKEIWRDTGSVETIHLIIRWKSRAQWKAVPHDLLAETDQRFAKALGKVYPVLRCTDLDVLPS